MIQKLLWLHMDILDLKFTYNAFRTEWKVCQVSNLHIIWLSLCHEDIHHMHICYNLYITHAHHMHFSLSYISQLSPHIHTNIHVYTCMQGNKGKNDQMSLSHSLNYSSLQEKLYPLCSLFGWLRLKKLNKNSWDLLMCVSCLPTRTLSHSYILLHSWECEILGPFRWKMKCHKSI